MAEGKSEKACFSLYNVGADVYNYGKEINRKLQRRTMYAYLESNF